jgi:hypothetical protein
MFGMLAPVPAAPTGFAPVVPAAAVGCVGLPTGAAVPAVVGAPVVGGGATPPATAGGMLSIGIPGKVSVPPLQAQAPSTPTHARLSDHFMGSASAFRK